MSKRKKRLEKLELKLEKELRKKARLLNRLELSKSPKIATPPSPCKIPKTITPGSNADSYMMWSSDIVDKEGSWSWGILRDWGEEIGRSLITPFLNQCCEKKWKEIRSERTGSTKDPHYKHVFYDTEVITLEAYKRLLDLGLDDQTRIFRFRLAAKKRLYGFVFGHFFAKLWYDPTHKIYPVD